MYFLSKGVTCATEISRKKFCCTWMTLDLLQVVCSNENEPPGTYLLDTGSQLNRSKSQSVQCKALLAANSCRVSAPYIASMASWATEKVKWQ